LDLEDERWREYDEAAAAAAEDADNGLEVLVLLAVLRALWGRSGAGGRDDEWLRTAEDILSLGPYGLLFLQFF
jgi:hypothetical protein